MFIKVYLSLAKANLAPEVRKPDPKFFTNNLNLAKKDFTMFLLLNLTVLTPIFAPSILFLPGTSLTILFLLTNTRFIIKRFTFVVFSITLSRVGI